MLPAEVSHAGPTELDQAYLWRVSAVATLGGFLFGYDWVVVGGAKPFYEAFFNVTTAQARGWGTSSALIGCIFGAFGCFLLGDRWGRRRLLIWAGLLFFVSAIGTAFASTFAIYNLLRIVGGLAMGIALHVSPLYISEMSPPEKRGMMVSANQLSIMIGVVVAQLANWRISLFDTALSAHPSAAELAASWNGQQGWRWMFGLEAVPALALFALMFLVPESIRWCLKVGQVERARRVLVRVGGEGYARREIARIAEGATDGGHDSATHAERALFGFGLRPVMLLGLFLAFFQQWCGMNVIFYYAADIFAAAGYGVQQMMLNIVVIGAVMVLSVFVAIALVDRLGRRKLMLFGAAFLAAGYGLIGLCFLMDLKGLPIVMLTLANVAVYSFTLAPVTWVLLAEIFPNRVRGAALSLAATALWIGNFTLTYSFPAIMQTLGWARNFWLYGGICVVGFVILWAKLPETRGLTLEEIARALSGGRRVQRGAGSPEPQP